MQSLSNLSSIALSGLQAAQTQLQVSANNVANGATPNYRRQEVQQSPQVGGGVQSQVRQSASVGPALELDEVTQLQARNSFMANLAVFKTSNQLAGALLDQKA